MFTRARLIELAGPSLAAVLMQRWGGHTVPRITEQQVRREARDAAIRRDFDGGMTYAETAEKHGVCVDTVWRVVRSDSRGNVSPK